MLKWLLRSVLRLCYRVRVVGLEHYRQAGERVLVVANHTSFLDAALLMAFMPDRLTFAVNTYVARRWWVRLGLSLVDFLPLDPTNPYSLKTLVRYLQENRRAVIFPEGRITVTGSLMKIYHGPGLVADRSDATLLPVRIDGAQYTPFSRLRGRVRLRWFPVITLTILPPSRLNIPAEVRGRARRKIAGERLSDLMAEMMFVTSNRPRTLFEAVLDSARVHGFDHPIAEDIERKPVNYRDLIARAFILGRAIARESQPGERLGVLLPGTLATVYTFFGMQAFGRVPAMLNFTAGIQGMRAACEVAQLKRVYTSRRFVQAGRLEAVIEALAAHVTIIYLEDLRDRLRWPHKLAGLLSARFPRLAYSGRPRPDDPAAVLFTSGSEGAPKGVVLSHANLLANCQQIAARVPFGSQDIILNALPLFHAFGLSAGTVLPITTGMRVFFYPSPLHYRIVPEMAYEVNATVLFGTNTFLSGYARFAHPYDFYSIRYVFAGAEKLKDETRRVWAEKFGIRIFEGYGATETSPSLTTNTPMDYRAGSVGRFLPGIEYRLDPVPGVEQGGRLSVRGPNVMLGYLLADRPGVLVPPQTAAGPGWYDTGDIASVDVEGYLRLLGRAKRFAKVAGEMVSLTAVEDLAARAWPQDAHACVSLPDARKGEQLVLLTTRAAASRQELQERARAEGVSELTVPRRLLVVKDLPVLGSGKTDYATAQATAEREAGA
ncbi:MAG: AMP-binding protein [Pseudomonadota bacterium]